MASAGDLDGFVAFAHELADIAGRILRHYYRATVAIEDKADASPVTIADREAEEAIRKLIRRRFPGHGIEGEEFGAERADAEFVWHLDPIDGTKSFLIGRPLFGTLIGLTGAGRPLLGVIDQCVLGERWLGATGEGSNWNGRPIRVRTCPSLDRAVLCLTSPEMFRTPQERAGFDRVRQAVRWPVYGGDCYAYGLLAMGLVDVIVEADMDAHDFLALVPVVEGAGGVMTDWAGQPLTASSEGRIVAAGDRNIHAQVVDLLGLRIG